MTDTGHPLAQELAIAHAGRAVRPILKPFLDLDLRMAEFVSQVKEPVLTQMRIAWWRDQLRKTPDERPKGDPILDALTANWAGEEPVLIALVDGWEALLAEPPLPMSAAEEFVLGRAGCFSAVARLSGYADAALRAHSAGLCWAWADLIASLSDAEERADILVTAKESPDGPSHLPRRLRSLTILEILARRSIAKGGSSLISNRTDLLWVMRVGIFGK